jgi:hypothetical protein
MLHFYLQNVVMDRISPSSQNIFPETRQQIIPRHGNYSNLLVYSLRWSKLTRGRAGANFSAISGGDANALRWDKLGYGHMMKLAEEHGVEACISKTPSFEYWDERPAHTKIDSMAEYLKDVSGYTPALVCRRRPLSQRNLQQV